MPITQTGTPIDIGAWLNTMYGDYAGTQAQYETAFGQGISTLQSAADLYAPGGAYGAGTEAMLGRQEKKAVASGMQSLVSSGLANTTMPMHLQQTFQEEVGVPTRMAAQDRQMQLYGGALSNLASAYGGYRPPGATTGGNIAMLATGGFSGQGSQFASMLDYLAQTRQDPNQLTSQNLFGDPGGGGGPGGGTGGGGTGGGGFGEFGGTGGGGFPNPYTGGGGGYGGGGFAEGELPVYMQGQRIEPGTEDIWKPKISRQAATELGIDPASRGYTYNPSKAAWIAPTGGGAGDESTTDNPFFDYAAQLTGISQYL